MSSAGFKSSLVSKSVRRASPILGRRKQHKIVDRSKSLQQYEERDYEDFEHIEKQDCYILRRNNSLPNISSISETEHYSNSWSRKLGYKRYSLKRSQSWEWEPINALFTAITEDDLEELERILQEFEIELNFLGPAGISLLHTAALVGSTTALQLLLNSGAEIEFQDASNRTSLEIALLAGHFDCAALLIENGACMSNIVDGIKFY